ncbi:MAG: hypothetical protein E7425_08435 [Ruminococcaceae bacterium]|jgi:hypothetical protein|nr:hypothetical protein [Oscillospiraceae bacterium]
MKKMSLIFCTALLLLLCAAPVHAAGSEPVAYAVYTDIVAKIDGYPIHSYYINERMAVVAEDLTGYGFNVEFDGKVVRISREPQVMPPEGWAEYMQNVPEELYGMRAAEVYASDYTARINGGNCECLSADGKVLIWMDNLADFGAVCVDSANRTVQLTFPESEHANSSPVLTIVSRGAELWLQNTEYTDASVIFSMNSFGVKLVHPKALFSDKSYLSSAYAKVFDSIKALGLPNVSYGDFANNSLEQRAAVAKYVTITLNGKPVSGDLWWSETNNQIDLNFSFDEALHLAETDELVISLGGSSTSLK